MSVPLSAAIACWVEAAATAPTENVPRASFLPKSPSFRNTSRRSATAVRPSRVVCLESRDSIRLNMFMARSQLRSGLGEGVEFHFPVDEGLGGGKYLGRRVGQVQSVLVDDVVAGKEIGRAHV